METHVNKKEIRQIYNQIKSSAKRRNIPFGLTLSDLNNLSFPITCPILGIPLFYNRLKSQPNSFSIDRRDSSKGYTPDNIIVISNRANTIKSDATLDELKKLVKYYSYLEEEEGFEPSCRLSRPTH